MASGNRYGAQGSRAQVNRCCACCGCGAVRSSSWSPPSDCFWSFSRITNTQAWQELPAAIHPFGCRPHSQVTLLVAGGMCYSWCGAHIRSELRNNHPYAPPPPRSAPTHLHQPPCTHAQPLATTLPNTIALVTQSAHLPPAAISQSSSPY